MAVAVDIQICIENFLCFPQTMHQIFGMIRIFRKNCRKIRLLLNIIMGVILNINRLLLLIQSGFPSTLHITDQGPVFDTAVRSGAVQSGVVEDMVLICMTTFRTGLAIHVVTAVLLSNAERIHICEYGILVASIFAPVIRQELESIYQRGCKAPVLLPAPQQNVCFRFARIQICCILCRAGCYFIFRHLYGHYLKACLQTFVPCQLRSLQNILLIIVICRICVRLITGSRYRFRHDAYHVAAYFDFLFWIFRIIRISDFINVAYLCLIVIAYHIVRRKVRSGRHNIIRAACQRADLTNRNGEIKISIGPGLLCRLWPRFAILVYRNNSLRKQVG